MSPAEVEGHELESLCLTSFGTQREDTQYNRRSRASSNCEAISALSEDEQPKHSEVEAFFGRRIASIIRQDSRTTGPATTQASSRVPTHYIPSTRARRLLKPLERRFHGWKWGVIFGLCTGTLVLVANIGLVVAGASTNNGYQEGVATLSVGKTAHISRMTTLFHILINIMSTVLLSASNYTMQVLSAPTRTACVKAHQDKKRLDIGIPSFRNLTHITTKKRVLWTMLFLSSIPLHLFWNAGIFQVSTDHDYDVELVAFSSHRDWELEQEYLRGLNGLRGSKGSKLEILSNREIKDTYDHGYVSEAGNLSLAVVSIAVQHEVILMEKLLSNGSRLGPSFTLPGQFYRPPTNTWLVDLQDHGYISFKGMLRGLNQSIFYTKDLQESSTNLIDDGAILFWIGGSYSLQFDGRSKILISRAFMLIVIICNVCKVFVMGLTLLDSFEAPLVTVGDAISAFMTEPDPYTRDLCTYSGEEFAWRTKKTKRQYRISEHLKEEIATKRRGIWIFERKSYIQSVSRPVWVTAILLCVIVPATVMTVLLSSGSRDRDSSGSEPIKPGWGTASSETFSFGAQHFDGPSTARLAFIANAPQILLSIMYLTFNAMFTCMSLAQEWNHLAEYEKGLRVTKREGEQRETYFLQLPFRWALPLNAFGGYLHWLTSQTMFLVRVDKFDKFGDVLENESIAACGFSSVSLMVLIVSIFILDIVAIIVGILPLEVKIPFGSSNSADISAACHSLDGTEDPTKKVKWGVISEGSTEEGTIGHCCFSNGKMKKPKAGVRYR